MAQLTTSDIIEKRGDKYVLVSKETGEVLGIHETEKEALAQEEAILISQAKRAERDSDDSAEVLDTHDFAPFSGVVSRDSNGFLRVRATVTAPGVYAYVRNGKIRHELKPPEEIYAPLHMESVHGAVVTDEHPSVAVTSDNSKDLQRGHSMSPPSRGDDGLEVDLVVTDESLISDALAGRKTGVSLGKRNTFEHSPGIWTAPDGSKHPYEVIQRNMVTNHIAIVSQPRVTSAQLHLDSLEQELGEQNKMTTETAFKVDGIPLTAAEHTAAVVTNAIEKKDAEIGTLKSQLAEATNSYDSLTEEKDQIAAERDAALAERDKLKSDLDSADALDINKLVSDRLELLKQAESVVTADKYEEIKGLSDMEIKRAACKASGAKLTQDSDQYFCAMFDLLVSKSIQSNDSALADASVHAISTTPKHEAEREAINERLRKHHDNMNSRRAG